MIDRILAMTISPEGRVRLDLEVEGKGATYYMQRRVQRTVDSYDISEIREVLHTRPWLSVAVKTVLQALSEGRPVRFPVEVHDDRLFELPSE